MQRYNLTDSQHPTGLRIQGLAGKKQQQRYSKKQAINKWYFTETADLDFHMQHDGQHDATIFKPCPSLSHVCQILIKNLGVNTGGLLSARLTAGGVVTTSMKVMW